MAISSGNSSSHDDLRDALENVMKGLEAKEKIKKAAITSMVFKPEPELRIGSPASTTGATSAGPPPKATPTPKYKIGDRVLTVMYGTATVIDTKFNSVGDPSSIVDSPRYLLSLDDGGSNGGMPKGWNIFEQDIVGFAPDYKPESNPQRGVMITTEQRNRTTTQNQLRIRDLKTGDVISDSDYEYNVKNDAAEVILFPIANSISGVAPAPKRYYSVDTTQIRSYGYSAHSLIDVAKIKKDGVDFDTVIMPQDKKDQIIEAINQVDNHDLIFNEWGFGEIFEKGTAISLLFYGPPGTGKTLMAQAIADKYGYKLQIISTAEIETPEPGGAERNIKQYFEKAAADGKTVLLFDECDSLIHDRSRVGMILAAQINALLTALEKHKGIVIFTTNRLGVLDPAFDRRVSLKLEFEMPGYEERISIWKRMFPDKAPLARDIRWGDLAQIEIAGGHIKNVVLKAARKAASAKAKLITDDILWDCLEKEVESMESFQDALENNQQFYGTPLANQGRGHKLIPTGRKQIDRGQ